MRIRLTLALAFGMVALGLSAAPHNGVVRAADQSAVPVPNPRDPAGTAVISGTVLDDATGTPAVGVRVTRWIWTDGSFQHEAITDTSGRYVLRGVGTGSYHVIAEFPGYVAGQNGMRTRDDLPRPVAVVDGQRLTVALRIFPQNLAHIRGTVTDDAGDAAAGVTVVLLRRRGAMFDFPTAVQADDRGEYEFPTVAGDFVVVVPPAKTLTLPAGVLAPEAPPNVAPGARPAIVAPDTPPMLEGPFRIFLGDSLRPALMPALGKRAVRAYPLTVTPLGEGDDAPSIRIENGETRTVDIRMKLEPAGVVSGRVVGPNGPAARVPVRLLAPLAARLIAGTDTGFDTAQALTDDHGDFRLTGVPAGHYLVRTFVTPDRPKPAGTTATIAGTGNAATIAMTPSAYTPAAGAPAGPLLWADDPLTTTGGAMTNLEVVLHRGAAIRGHLVLAPTSAAPPDVTKFFVGLRPADATVQGVSSTHPDAAGRFEAGEYPTGRYVLTLTVNQPAARWIVKSAKSGEQDLFFAPFALPSEGLDDVVVTLTDAVATVHGVVQGETGAPADRGAVLLFPAHPIFVEGVGAPAQGYKQIPVGADGRFTVPAILAGDYEIIAVSQNLPAWSEAASIATLARAATPITLAESQDLTMTLKAQAVRVR